MEIENINEKKEYLVAFIVSEEDASSVSAIVEKHGGEITVREELAKVRLAYPIQKQQFAFSGSFIVSGSSELPAKISADIKFEPRIVRLMVTKKPDFPEARPALNPHDAARARMRRRDTGTKRPATGLSNEALERKIEEILQ
jgi:ribosomal protein S6